MTFLLTQHLRADLMITSILSDDLTCDYVKPFHRYSKR